MSVFEDFTIQDVSGKGIPATLAMSMGQILPENFIYMIPDEPGALAEAVSRANRLGSVRAGQ